MSRLEKNEQGMVSILVTMIMIIVISLIVLGFAQITRRNQREALDNQLSTQAYYAAESGVSAAIDYLTDPTNATAVSAGINNTTCTDFLANLTPTGVSNILDSATNTKYSCLMVNTEPPNLELSPLTQGASSVLHLANTDNQAFNALNFKWRQQASPNFSPATCSGSGGSGKTLPQYSAWNCPFGILRLDLVDTSNTGGHISNAALQDGTYAASFYLIPSYASFPSSHTVQWPPAAQPINPATPPGAACSSAADSCPVQIVPVHCTSGANSNCSMELKLINGVPPGVSKDYYVRLTMMYQDTNDLIITGGDSANPLNLATGQGVHFTSGQALIDSTGQSEDELRRVQVRIPLSAATGPLPAYGLQTTDTICKQLSDGPSVATTDNCPAGLHP